MVCQLHRVISGWVCVEERKSLIGVCVCLRNREFVTVIITDGGKI